MKNFAMELSLLNRTPFSRALRHHRETGSRFEFIAILLDSNVASTFCPGRTRCSPLTITCSPGFRPLEMIRMSPRCGTQFDGSPRGNAVAPRRHKRISCSGRSPKPARESTSPDRLDWQELRTRTNRPLAKASIFVFKHAANSRRAGAGADFAFDKVELSFVGKILFVGQLQIAVDPTLRQTARSCVSRFVRAAACI